MWRVFLFLLFPMFSLAQDTADFKLDFNISAFHMSSQKTVFSVSSSSMFGVYYKQYSAEVSTKYNYSKVNGEKNLLELNSRVDISKNNYFSFFQLEKSYTRKIDQRYQVGAGYGKTLVNTKSIMINTSYALLGEKTYFPDSMTFYIRHSARLKTEWRLGTISLKTETYFQPIFNDISQNIFDNDIKASIGIHKNINFIAEAEYTKEAFKKEISIFSVGVNLQIK